VSRSRWAMLLTPGAFMVVFELLRIDAVGPTVDAVRPGSTYGLVAFAVGRGLHGLLALLPMVLGAALGAGLARRLSAPRADDPPRRGRALVTVRRSVAALTGLALVLLAAQVARPASTDPITTTGGQPVPGSVAELTRVHTGGHDLALMIRGTSADNPVLLFLAGGPGGSELGAMRRHGQTLEQAYVVATLDQRGTGKSYDQIEPTSTLTLDAAVDDVVNVTDYLRHRFGQDRVYLVGNSWGTILGVLAVQRHPELFAAFVGAGQMVSPRETDRVFYDDTLAWARHTGRTDLVDTLVTQGPPPYAHVLDYEPLLGHPEDVYPYDHSANDEGAGGFSENLAVEEYSFLQQAHALGGMVDVFTVLYPQIQDIDFRATATRLDVPVFLVEGRHEARGRLEPVREWFALLHAPQKRLVMFGTSGHRPLFEQPDRFHDLMTDVVLDRT